MGARPGVLVLEPPGRGRRPASSWTSGPKPCAAHTFVFKHFSICCCTHTSHPTVLSLQERKRKQKEQDRMLAEKQEELER